MKDQKPFLVVSVEVRDIFTQFAACYFDAEIHSNGLLTEDAGHNCFPRAFESIKGITTMFREGNTTMMLPPDDMQGLENWVDDHDDHSFMIELLHNSKVIATIAAKDVWW